jgi:hypothetical protein
LIIKTGFPFVDGATATDCGLRPDAKVGDHAEEDRFQAHTALHARWGTTGAKNTTCGLRRRWMVVAFVSPRIYLELTDKWDHPGSSAENGSLPEPKTLAAHTPSTSFGDYPYASNVRKPYITTGRECTACQ